MRLFHYILLSFYVIGSCRVVAQGIVVPDKKYSKIELRADFRFLRAILEEAHPSLYQYTSKEVMSTLFDETYRKIGDEMTEKEFGLLLKPLVTKIRCGHTDIRYSPETRKINRIRNRTQALPLGFWIDNDRLFIAKNDSKDSIRLGTEVLEIEGNSVGKILRTLRKYLPADGYGEQYKDAMLENGFFEDYYLDVFGGKERYQFVIKTDNGLAKSIMPELKPRILPTRPPRVAPDVELSNRLNRLRNLTYPTEVASTALLKIASFSYDDYESYLMIHERFFKELEQRNIKNLIIDLRQNLGGNHEIALDLMKYLMDTDFILTASAEAPVFIPSFISNNDVEQQESNRTFSEKMIKKCAEGTYCLNIPSVGKHKPYDLYRFKGSVYVLISEQTFSAASSFVASLKAQKAVTLIGRETGGGEAGCNGGIISTVVLPATKLRVLFPHFRITTAVKVPNIGRGVEPDIAIHYSIAQRLDKQDLELSKVYELIRKRELSKLGH